MNTNYISSFICSIFGRDRQDGILNIEPQTEVTLTKLLNELPEEQRKVLDLRYQGLMIEDIAKACEISEEEVRQREALALRFLRHPNRSKQLRDFIYGYSSSFEGKRINDNLINGCSIDITDLSSVAITGNREDAIAVKEKLLEDIRKCDKGFMDFYESSNHQKTEEILINISEIAKERDKFLKDNNFDYIRDYNCSHLSPGEKIHHILIVIENYNGSSESEELQGMLREILINGYRLGIHVIYVTDTDEHQIAYNSGESVALDVVSKTEINMMDDWNIDMVLKI